MPKIAKFVATETMPVNYAALNTDRTWYPNMVPSSGILYREWCGREIVLKSKAHSIYPPGEEVGISVGAVLVLSEKRNENNARLTFGTVPRCPMHLVLLESFSFLKLFLCIAISERWMEAETSETRPDSVTKECITNLAGTSKTILRLLVASC